VTGSGLLRIAPVSPSGRTGEPGDGGGQQLELIAGAAKAGADLIILPQLGFTRYFPAARDRAALELGEREPFASLRSAAEQSGPAHLFASVYECVGEGVFYVRGELLGPGGESLVVERQRRVEAAPGRYEQMFFSPGHGPRRVVETPWGPTGILIGADARDAGVWRELADLGAELVVAGVSEDGPGWEITATVARGMAAALGFAVAVVNREEDGDPGFPGGSMVVNGRGAAVEADSEGIFELELPAGGD
jgi:beta-ureidopropionase